MKRFLSVFLIAVLCICACGCGGKEVPEKKDATSIVRDAVESRIMVEIALSYETVGAPNITAYVNETSKNTYEVTGKVTVKDKYGDSYTGKYDAKVKFDPSTEKATVSSLDLDSLYKD